VRAHQFLDQIPYRKALSAHISARNARDALPIVIDIVSWALSILTALVLRQDFAVSQIVGWSTVLLIGVVAALQISLGAWLRLYSRRYVLGSLEEARMLALTTFLSALVAALLVFVWGQWAGVPRSTIPIAAPVSLLLMAAARYALRVSDEAVGRPRPTATAIIYGAGNIGTSLVRRLLTDARSPYIPVALLDDDARKRQLRVRNVDVEGTLADLPAVVARTGAQVLVVAIARADAGVMRRVSAVAEPLGLKVKVVPALDEILNRRNAPVTLRDLSIEDIVGRRPVDTDVASIADYIMGKRVLITGAGGSIGLELCRQVNRYGPAELIMLDRDETGLQSAELLVFGHGLLTGPEVVLADIRDGEALRRIFAERRPEVVFHAAALKHLPMLQQYPDEAWKTNVIGTLNVLKAARLVGVDTFVNISTDKAANPCSVLGHSKRLAERLTAWMGRMTGRRYLSVRFGNVLGSRGSMLPLFTSMIERGGPVTVTHPDVTRYFMTIPEACQLVVQAGGIGRPSEVLILDMGEQVRILDVATRMIEMADRDIEIVFTGLREGEKLHEVLLADGEADNRPIHPKISHTRVSPLAPDKLDQEQALDEWCGHPALAGPTPVLEVLRRAI
jgi:dTDP-glucose 4,6-dehydratase